MIQAGQALPSVHNEVDGFQPVSISRFAEKKEAGGASVTPVSGTPTVCYYGNPCANAIFLAIYQNAGCHTTIPCVVIKRIQTQMWLLLRTSGKAALDIAAHQSSNMLTA